MKSLTTYITEKMIYNKSNSLRKYNYHPETKEELQDIINQLIEERGNEGDFNDIDTSNITDMSELFQDMEDFNGDISNWDVSNVKNMFNMFCKSKFNGDISKWKVAEDTDLEYMFEDTLLEKNPPKWYKDKYN